MPEKQSSIGFMSGEYGGRNSIRIPLMLDQFESYLQCVERTIPEPCVSYQDPCEFYSYQV